MSAKELFQVASEIPLGISICPSQSLQYKQHSEEIDEPSKDLRINTVSVDTNGSSTANQGKLLSIFPQVGGTD